MNNTKHILLIIIGVLSMSCSKDVDYGLDKSLARPENLQYDEVNSTDTDLSVYWDATKALNSGAVSFTVELVKDKIGLDVNPPSQIVLKSDAINDAAIFSGFKKGQKYHVRARANYHDAKYSDWTWIMTGDSLAVIRFGAGIVNETVDVVQKPSSSLNWASSRQLAVNYSTTAFADRSVDITYNFKVELYKDAACSDLQVALDLPSSLHDRTFAKMADFFPGFVFSELEPDTDYYCRVTCYNSDKGNPSSDVVKYHTLADDTVMIGAAASAEVGDILLCENFDRICWGGDMVHLCAGISRKDRSTVTAFSFPTGDRTGDKAFSLKEVANEFNYCKYHNEYGLFNSVGKCVRNIESLKSWGQLNENSKATKGTICVRPGMVKMGAGQKLGILATPELSSLKGDAKVKVTFVACNYNEEKTGEYDTKTKAVYVLDGTTIDANNYLKQYYGNVTKTETLVEMSEEDYGWHTYEVTLEHVKPTSRIAIGGTRSVVASGQNRFYLDHVKIELISYE